MVNDWSYRYTRPRSEVHYERYGTTAVPPRRGLGGRYLGNPRFNLNSSVNWVIFGAIAVGLGLVYLSSRK